MVVVEVKPLQRTQPSRFVRKRRQSERAETEHCRSTFLRACCALLDDFIRSWLGLSRRHGRWKQDGCGACLGARHRWGGQRGLSANGAASYQPGATPQETDGIHMASVESATHPAAMRPRRWRSPPLRAGAWGVAPGWDDAAPLALSGCAVVAASPHRWREADTPSSQRLRAGEAPTAQPHISLGQRPRTELWPLTRRIQRSGAWRDFFL